ncbi:MAG: prepilin-type N-terminal cleavage/methylation domain-containing protein [Armatimonadetes bacterium]|nr:prepilin-type N-terminal cleavage/methylation domain-containing protein [Armatimonadota bacterium]
MIKLRGFTLVEVLVSMALIVLVLVFSVRLFPLLNRGVQLSATHSQAAALGQSLLERERNRPFDAIAPYRGSHGLSSVRDGNEAIVKLEYSVDTTVLEPNCRRVWVELEWSETGGRKKVVLETILSRKSF